MKILHFIYILFIGILITIISMLFTTKRENVLQLKLCTEQNLKMDGFYKYLRFKDKEMLLNNGTTISPDLLLFDEYNKQVRLLDLVSDSNGAPKVVIRLSAFACDICLDEEVKILKNFVPLIGKENIIIFP